MTISARVAKSLCTKTEHALVRESSARDVTKLSERQLSSKILRSRKLRDKYRDLASRQERESRGKQSAKRRRPAQGSGRTREKEQLFAETLERFQSQLKKLKATKKSKATANKKAKKKPASAKKKPGKQKAVKKSVTKKKPAIKKSVTKKKPAKRKAARKSTAKKRKTKTTSSASRSKARIPKSAKKAKASAKQARLEQSGRIRRTSHLSSTNRRKQSRRNAPKR